MGTKHTTTERDRAGWGAFASEEAARAAKPDNPRYSIYRVTVSRPIPAGVYYTWNDGTMYARDRVAAALGVEAEKMDKSASSIAEATPELLAAGLRARGVPESVIEKMVEALAPKAPDAEAPEVEAPALRPTGTDGAPAPEVKKPARK